MAYTLPDPSITTPDGLLGYLATQVPFLVPLILLLVFLALTMSGYFYQERRNGRANLPLWLAISSFITTTSSFFLFLIPNVMNIETVSIAIAFTLVFMGWFIFNPEE